MVKLVALIGWMISLVVALAGAASAQTYPPPGLTSVTPPNPTPGSTVALAGACNPGETMTVNLVDGQDAAELISTGQVATTELAAVRTLGSTTVGSDGTWSITVTIPTDVASPALLQVIGSECGAIASVAVLLAQAPPTTAGEEGVAFTGTRAGTMLPVAVALIAIGGIVVLVVRQRRRDRVPTEV